VKKLLAMLDADQKEPTREIVRIVLTTAALHAILNSDAYRGLTVEEKGLGAVNLADAAMKALEK
jgi:hypothetical protein